MSGIRSLVVAGMIALFGSFASAATLNIDSVDGTGTFSGQPSAVTSTGAVLLGTLTYARVRGSGTFQDSFEVTVNGTADGQAFSLTQLFNFAKATACGKPSCTNFFAIIPSSATPLVITQGRTVFTIFVDGFVEAIGGPVMTQFRSLAGGSRGLLLQGSVTIAPIPVPASGLLLFGALRGVAALRKRRAA